MPLITSRERIEDIAKELKQQSYSFDIFSLEYDDLSAAENQEELLQILDDYEYSVKEVFFDCGKAYDADGEYIDTLYMIYGPGIENTQAKKEFKNQIARIIKDDADSRP